MKYVKIASLFVVCLLLLGMLTACAQPAAKKLAIASDASFPPMEFVDESKKIVGFDIDLMTAIAKDQKLEFEIKNTAWDGIFAGLEGGAYDAILSSVTVTDERKQKYDFSEPYINAGQSVVVRADEANIKSDKDLPGKTSGAQIGTTGAIAVGKIKDAKLKEYDTPDLALLDLLNKNIDAVVVDTPVAADLRAELAAVQGQAQDRRQAVHRRGLCVDGQEGRPEEAPALFNAGLANVKKSGEYDKIYAKWIGGSSK